MPTPAQADLHGMEVRDAIDEVRGLLEHTNREEELLLGIQNRLLPLREAFPTQRALFTPSDIEFLKSLTPIPGHLQAFMSLREELHEVNSLEVYEVTVKQLTEVKEALLSFPVGRRVSKEIRELNERLPAIRELSDLNRRFRLTTRIDDLNRKSRRCAHGHAMVIREGRRGYFWGCSNYPFCEATADLTAEQKARLS